MYIYKFRFESVQKIKWYENRKSDFMYELHSLLNRDTHVSILLC